MSILAAQSCKEHRTLSLEAGLHQCCVTWGGERWQVIWELLAEAGVQHLLCVPVTVLGAGDADKTEVPKGP